MKTNILLGIGVVVYFGATPGFGQWRLERMNEPHELRLDRTLPGVWNVGTNLNGRWITTERSERRTRPEQESFFYAESFSVFYESMDYGSGKGAPTRFGLDMSGTQGRDELEFHFGKFMEASELGIEETGSRRVFTHDSSLYSAQGYTFRFLNKTGETIRGLKVKVEVWVRGGPDSGDKPKLEMQISRNDRNYEAFMDWMPSEIGEIWKREMLEGTTAEEIAPGEGFYVRIWTGIGTGPRYASLGWSGLTIQPMSEKPVIEPRTPAEDVPERSNESPVEPPMPNPEPVQEMVLEQTITVPVAAPMSPGGPAPIEAENPASWEKVSDDGESRAALWVLAGVVLFAVGLLGFCGFALIRHAAQ
ncbi:MAG: hypothetical protein OHK005_20840 [Candidatus Methylacidiphilales bacterium]